MNIIESLMIDHNKVRKILSEIDKTTSRATTTRQKDLYQLKKELKIHEAVEENILYPVLRRNHETKELILESYEEHHLVDQLLSELEMVQPNEENWKAKFSLLKNNLEHHIYEEEVSLFPKSKKILKSTQLEDLADEMSEYKKTLEEESLPPENEP